MLRTESKRAVKRFGDELQNVLDTCMRDADELKLAFSKGPLGTGEEAVKLFSTKQAEAEQLQSKVPPLNGLVTDTPRAGDMLDAAFAHLKAIAEVFDRFEERLESAYGIAPVVLPEHKAETTENAQARAAESIITGAGPLSSLRPENSTNLTMTPMGRTPRSARKKDVDMPIPATPKLEDFGISQDYLCEELRGLGMSSTGPPSTQKGSASILSKYETTTPRNEAPVRTGAIGHARAGAKAVELDLEGDIEEKVQLSMTALGIETPGQVEEKFESKRHEALTRMMLTTTPRLKSGGVERTVDYTGLAGGYYRRGGGAETGAEADTHRQLNFDETPRVDGGRGSAEDEGMRERIAESFDRLGFWRDKVQCEQLEEAAVVLRREGRGIFDKRGLTKVLNEWLPGVSCYSIIASLTKLGVLQMDKRPGEEARYRIG